VADLAEAAARETVASRKPNVLGIEPAAEVAHAASVSRIAVVVAAVPVEHPLVGGAVHVVDVASDRGQATGEERLAQPLGGE
jgi:hypothetical protein